MKFKFAIPSYNRAEKQRTLELLSGLGFSKNDIVLSTQTEKDFEEYTEKYNGLCVIIYKAGNSAADNRNNLLEYFKEGDWIMMLDDDISGFFVLKGDKLAKVSSKDELEKMITSFFEYTEKVNGKMWGIYPVKNAFFMKKTIDKRCIVNGCLGIINYLKFDNGYRTKEDFEMCCRLLRNGKKVVRFNFVTADIKSKQKGGCHEDWKAIKENEEIAYNLTCKYPELVRLNPKRRGEVVFCGNRN